MCGSDCGMSVDLNRRLCRVIWAAKSTFPRPRNDLESRKIMRLCCSCLKHRLEGESPREASRPDLVA